MPEVVPGRTRHARVCTACPPDWPYLRRRRPPSDARPSGAPDAATGGHAFPAAARPSIPIRASRRANVESQSSGGPRAWRSWPVTCPYRLPTRLFAPVLAAQALQAIAADRQILVLVHGATAGGWEYRSTSRSRAGEEGQELAERRGPGLDHPHLPGGHVARQEDPRGGATQIAESVGDRKPIARRAAGTSSSRHWNDPHCAQRWAHCSPRRCAPGVTPISRVKARVNVDSDS